MSLPPQCRGVPGLLLQTRRGGVAMKRIRTAAWAAATMVGILGAAVRAEAGLMQVTDASGLSAGDTTAAYTGADGAVVSAPYVLSAGGNTLTYTEVSGND